MSDPIDNPVKYLPRIIAGYEYEIAALEKLLATPGLTPEAELQARRTLAAKLYHRDRNRKDLEEATHARS